MKTQHHKHAIALSHQDAASIRKLLRQAEITAAGLPPPACVALETLLEHASILDPEHPALEARAGLCDPVTLVSPDDRSDWYRMEIVPPAEACVDEDRISLAHPMSLAVLGRRLGETVQWDTGHGLRTMRLESIEKAALASA